MTKPKDYKPENFKTVRLFDKTLDLATELVAHFDKQGYKSSWTSVVDAGIQLMHSTLIDENYTLASKAELEAQRAEIDANRAFDIGTAIAAFLSVVCAAKIDMRGCEMAYLPAVDAIAISLPDIPDTLFHAAGADPVTIANVATEQLLSRGYVQDDGTRIVDMDRLLGETPVREGA